MNDELREYLDKPGESDLSLVEPLVPVGPDEPPGVADLREALVMVREELADRRAQRDALAARIKQLVGHEDLLRRAVAVFDKANH